jgi:hypothetical protein
MPYVASIPELNFGVCEFDDAVAGTWNFSPAVSIEEITLFATDLSKGEEGWRYVHLFVYPITEDSYGMWYMYRLTKDDPRHVDFENNMRARLKERFKQGFMGGFVGESPWMILPRN